MNTTKALKTFSKIERIANDMWLTSLSAQCAMTEKNREKMMDKIIRLNEKLQDVTSANWH